MGKTNCDWKTSGGSITEYRYPALKEVEKRMNKM